MNVLAIVPLYILIQLTPLPKPPSFHDEWRSCDVPQLMRNGTETLAICERRVS